MKPSAIRPAWNWRMTCPKWLKVLFLLLHGLILYFLSVGPAGWFAEVINNWLFWVVFEVFYYPLIILADKFDWIGDLIEWYVSLWYPD